jgi:hypothetical protein
LQSPVVLCAVTKGGHHVFLSRLVQATLHAEGVDIASARSSDFGGIAHGLALLIGEFVFFNKVGKFVGVGSGFASVGSTVGVGHLLIVTKDVVDAAHFVAIAVFAVTTLQALELALLEGLVCWVVVCMAVGSHLFLLTALVVGMCLANQVQIFLVEQSIFGLALFPSALSPLALALALLFVIFFVFVYYETFTNLAALLESRFQQV